MARIREARQAFSQMDQQLGAGLVRPAVDFLDSQLSALLVGAYSDQVRGDLLSAASSMTQLAGWMADDLGHHGQAQRRPRVLAQLILRQTRAEAVTAETALGSHQVDTVLACDFIETVTCISASWPSSMHPACPRPGRPRPPDVGWVLQPFKNLVMDLENVGCRARSRPVSVVSDKSGPLRPSSLSPH